MLTKTKIAVVTALVLTTVALSGVASAQTYRGQPDQAEQNYFDRASRGTDGAGF